MSAYPAAMIINMNDLGVDAFKALEALQADPALRSIPILAFANHEEVDTWRRAKELGVTKVVSRNEFSSRTKDLVEGTYSPSAVPTVRASQREHVSQHERISPPQPASATRRHV